MPIIYGRPLLNITIALVEIREFKLTLRVAKKEITFTVDERSRNTKANNDVYFKDKVN